MRKLIHSHNCFICSISHELIVSLSIHSLRLFVTWSTIWFTMFSKCYKAEEKDGFIRTCYYRMIPNEKIEKNLIDLKNVYSEKGAYLDMYLEQKELNNFDFYLNQILDTSVTNYLEEWEEVQLSNMYNYILYDNDSGNDIFRFKKGYLELKLDYMEETKIISSYFKTNCRNVKWEGEKKVWHIPLFYLYDITKLTLYIGGKVSDMVLFHLFKLFSHLRSVTEINMKEPKKPDQPTTVVSSSSPHQEKTLQANSSNEQTNGTNELKKQENGTNIKKESTKVKISFIQFIKEYKTQFINQVNNQTVFKFEHIIIINCVKTSAVRIKLIPYNEEVISKFKEHAIAKWDKAENIWTLQKVNFKSFYTDIIQFFKFKLCSHYDYYKMNTQKLLEYASVNILKRKNMTISNETKNTASSTSAYPSKRVKHEEYYDSSSDSCNSEKLSKHVDSSFHEGRESVTKIKLIGAAKDMNYEERIYDKLKDVKKLKPPNCSLDTKGAITRDGAGTKGVEILRLPADIYEWNRISFCVVPNKEEYINLYDPKILCSLVSDVYLLKEKAIDIILKGGEWPENRSKYGADVFSKNEFIVRNKNFNTRQNLAHDRLFQKNLFYIFDLESVALSNYNNGLFLCKSLITLGEGKFVTDPLDSDYIVVENSEDKKAIHFYKSLLKQKKRSELPCFVTPKFIYDCVLDHAVLAPSENKKHFAFLKD